LKGFCCLSCLTHQACPRFSHITLTGGAIGSGPPLALGAAIACPGTVVINIQVRIFEFTGKGLLIYVGDKGQGCAPDALLYSKCVTRISRFSSLVLSLTSSPERRTSFGAAMHEARLRGTRHHTCMYSLH
jgi:hypothetical protein